MVEADIFSDGPAALAAVIQWRRSQDESFTEAPMVFLDNDRWRGEFPLAENTRYVFAIEAWARAFISHGGTNFVKKTAAGLDAYSDLLEGIALLENVSRRVRGAECNLITDYIARLRALNNPAAAVASVSASELVAAVDQNEERADSDRHWSG